MREGTNTQCDMQVESSYDVDSKGVIEDKARVLKIRAKSAQEAQHLLLQLRSCIRTDLPENLSETYENIRGGLAYFGCSWGESVSKEGRKGVKGLSWNDRWLVGRPGWLMYYEHFPSLTALESIVVSECILQFDSGRLLMNLMNSQGVLLAFRSTHRDDFDRWYDVLKPLVQEVLPMQPACRMHGTPRSSTSTSLSMMEAAAAEARDVSSSAAPVVITIDSYVVIEDEKGKPDHAVFVVYFHDGSSESVVTKRFSE